MAYLKPQSPIKNGDDHVYPLTTVDQVIMPDGSRLGNANGLNIDASDVGARSGTWLPSHDDIRTMTLGTWNGNTIPNDIPLGITYVSAGDTTEGHGFPAGYVTVFALKDTVHRLFQLLVEKTNGRMRIRSATDGTTWGSWYSLYGENNKLTYSDVGAASASHTHTGMYTTSNLTFSLSDTTLTITKS